MALSAEIKKRRKELGLTLAELAKLVGVTEATVQRWESGNIKTLRYGRIEVLASALQTTPMALQGWDTSAIDEFDDTKKAPAMQEPGSISLEGSNSLLAALGLVEDGYELSDDDLAFLTNVLGLLNNWFRRNQP